MNLLIKKLFNKETISYLFFGVITTIINYVFYEICRATELNYRTSTVIAWIVAVIFAFLTNKLFVFNSRSFSFSLVRKEFTSFILARLTSGVIDLLFMIICIDYLGIEDSIAKISSNIIVVIINYLLSKLVVFRKC